MAGSRAKNAERAPRESPRTLNQRSRTFRRPAPPAVHPARTVARARACGDQRSRDRDRGCGRGRDPARNGTALGSFRQATDTIAGAASLSVVSRVGPLDETVLRDLLWLRDHGDVSPVIEGYALFRGKKSVGDAKPEDGTEEYLQILGTDILRDRDVRSYTVLRLHAEGRQPTGREFLELLRAPNAIVLTQKFAMRHNVDVGDVITCVFNDRRVDLEVRGLLLDEEPARSLRGNFALMDIAAAQLAFDRLGELDRIDVKISGHDERSVAAGGSTAPTLASTSETIAKRLPNSLAVATPEERYEQVETMLRAFHFNLTALGSLALVVGL